MKKELGLTECQLDNKFDDALIQVKDICGQLSITLTFFEITYVCSKIIASQNNVEYLILETGLGGRLDATRCSKADICLLTSITKEHSDILGQDIYRNHCGKSRNSKTE